jgi:predicted DNA binding protein
MATLITGTLPRETFVLSETLAAIPDATFECEKIVESSKGTVMPLVWARAPDYDRLDDAIRTDPTTENAELLSEFDGEWLYRMEWVDYVQLVVQMLTTSDATVLSASTKDGMWVLRVMYPTHDEVSDTVAYCKDHGIPFEITSIREMDSDSSGRYGLTEAQYEALTTAYGSGYFEIPRGIDLNELAEELDISHQALSERLRRASAALVEDTLLTESDGAP